MTHAILTCSPYFIGLALNELKRQHPQLNIVSRLSAQHVLLENPGTFDALTRPWRHSLPIYLHHLFPIHQSVPLDGSTQDFDTCRAAVDTIAAPDATVQVRIAEDIALPYTAFELQQHLQPDSTADPLTDPQGRILSLLIACHEGKLTAHLGISWATQNISPWPGGRRRYAEIVPNRAGFKLLEALKAFEIRLWPETRALDLGAAPGAWTTVLRRRGVHVTAIAPATHFYDWLTVDPGVHIQRMTAEAYRTECRTTFGLITNDMIIDAQDSARLMHDYAEHLNPGGIAIMTLKLRERGHIRVMDHAMRLLRKQYKIIRVRQLVSNRREVTLFLRRKE